MSKEQNEVLEQQWYLLERRMYRLDPAPPKLPAQEYIVRYLTEKKDKYLTWYLHDQEPALNKLAQAACERYAMAEHFADIKQAAVCGILVALQMYDPAVGAPFAAFQKRYIQDGIDDYSRTAQSGVITMTADTYPVLRRIMAIYHLNGDNCGDDSVQRIADEIGMDAKTVRRYIAIGTLNERRVDFYRQYDEDGEETAEDISVDTTSQPDKLYFRAVLYDALHQAYGSLTYREQRTVAKHAPRLQCIVHILFSGIFMKSSKLPGMLSVKSKKGLDYMDMILKTTDLCKNFKGQMAVNNVSLNIRRNSVYGLLGPNGAGKSTILKMLTGILRPTSGSIEFDGHPWKRNDLEHIGALIEMPPLYENLTAYENLKVRTTLLGLDDARINEVLQIVQLTNTGKKRAGQFSLGMKQRLGIAIALLNSPQLLILDEPTNGLDPLGIEELRELIRSFPCKGITVILSSHILSEVQQIADHVGIIAGGVLGYEGELRAGEDLEQLFMDVIRRNGKEGY